MKEHFFTRTTSIRVRHRNAFKPPVLDLMDGADSKVEIPPLMLALVATAVRPYSSQVTRNIYFRLKVYAAIAEFLTDESMKPDFSASVYTDAYHRHVATLKDIKNRNAQAYHALTATLFNEYW